LQSSVKLFTFPFREAVPDLCKDKNYKKYLISAFNLALTKRTISIQYQFNYFAGIACEEKSLYRRRI
jgi:hypothetical protein